MKVKRAAKYGFCAGVRIADQKVKKFAAQGDRGFILGQVVHNERVVDEMERLGVHTVEAIDEVEAGTIVFSAHGVPPSFHDSARQRGLRILDTTCPFVYDIHDEAGVALSEGAHLVFIGDPRHREVVGYTKDLDPSRYHVLMTVEDAEAVDWSRYPKVKIFYQTTLNSEEFEPLARTIESRVPDARRADTICYATKQNQDAAHELGRDPEVGVILVIGGRRSANTRHLWEICRRYKPSYLIQGTEDLRAEWFAGVETVGVTAGASTPDYVVDEVERALTTSQLAVGIGS
ncbi:MAG TPA: 4-hydroxy-3-methylbut-2-enyl diphosphate reductase [Thermoanaerobaculia bacterium]|nr:4-hydroxy-3-methylbut-2-enyl diphosphate reductase [Thermoanaerobaculia bacterium]